MMIVRCLMAFALLAPVAAADGFMTRVDYAEGYDACYGHHYQNESYETDWWYRADGAYSSCYDSFEYVGADVWGDDGTQAGAHVVSSQGQGSQYHRSEEHRFSYGNGSYWSDSEQRDYSSSNAGWARGADARLNDAQAGASHGCSNHDSSSWNRDETYDAREYDGTWYETGAGTSSASDSRHDACGQSVYAAHEDEAVGAGHTNGCSDSSGWYSSSFSERSGDSGDSSRWYSRYSNNECGDRVHVSGPVDASGRAGSSCTSNGFGVEESWWSSADGNYTYDSAWYGYDQSHCRDGVAANGPDDVGVFAGRDHRYSSWCESSGECTTDSWESVGIELAWEHNPLGPWPVSIFVPIPQVPSPSVPTLP